MTVPNNEIKEELMMTSCEEFFGAALVEQAVKMGCSLEVNADSIDISCGIKTVRINKLRHKIYLYDIINSFDYYFSAVEAIHVNDKLLVDYSLPKYHDVNGFDLHPIFFPSFAEPVVTTKQYSDFAQLKEGDVVFDLGGYSGLCAIMMKEIVGSSGRVITVEADRDNLLALNKNINLYKKLTGFKVEVLFGAVYNHSYGISFSREGNMGSSSVEYVGNERGFVDTVPSFTLSKITDIFKVQRVDFIKCDIEGAEAVIFLDNEFFHRFKPKIVVEAHYDFGKERIISGINRLKKYGYTFEEIVQHGVSMPLIACNPRQS